MDSLLANYASSDDEADEAPPAPASAAARGSEAGSKPAASTPSSSSFGGGGIFSSLPQPKSTPVFSSLPAPKSGPTFSAIPPPKSSGNTIKKKSPPETLSASSSTARSRSGSPPATPPTTTTRTTPRSAAPRPLRPAPPCPLARGPCPRSSLRPNTRSVSVAVEARGPGGRQSIRNLLCLQLQARLPKLEHRKRPKLLLLQIMMKIQRTAAVRMTCLCRTSWRMKEENPGADARAGQQQQQGYDAAAGSNSGGYEAYAWDPNQYAQYAANYGWDPNANASYAAGEQYAAYGGEQGGGYAHPQGGEYVAGYANAAVAPYGADYTGVYGHEAAAAASFPPVQDPVLPPVMGRIGGKRGRNDMPTEIVEVNREELMKNRPKQDKSKLTGLAFGPSYQPAPSAKGKPSKLHKRKHQIGSLYFDMKSKEMELAERRSKGILTKAETQAKYGW